MHITRTVNSASIQFKETRQIARMADIHGVGNAGPRRRDFLVFSCFQKNREFIVFVSRHNKLGYRKSHAAGKFTAESVAEISGRHGKNNFLTTLGELRVRVNIINNLRQDTTEIYRIGGR